MSDRNFKLLNYFFHLLFLGVLFPVIQKVRLFLTLFNMLFPRPSNSLIIYLLQYSNLAVEFFVFIVLSYRIIDKTCYDSTWNFSFFYQCWLEVFISEFNILYRFPLENICGNVLFRSTLMSLVHIQTHLRKLNFFYPE